MNSWQDKAMLNVRARLLCDANTDFNKYRVLLWVRGFPSRSSVAFLGRRLGWMGLSEGGQAVGLIRWWKTLKRGSNILGFSMGKIRRREKRAMLSV